MSLLFTSKKGMSVGQLLLIILAVIFLVVMMWWVGSDLAGDAQGLLSRVFG